MTMLQMEPNATSELDDAESRHADTNNSLSVLDSLRKGMPKAGTSVDFTYRILKSAIIDGALSPGTRLVEEAVASQLRVSRTPVRQAIAQLELEHLVSRVPRVGVVVSELESDQIEDVYLTRAVLEGLAARLAAQSMRTGDHAQLRYLQSKIEEAVDRGDHKAASSINFEFHNLILRAAARNETLMGFLAQIHDATRRFRESTMSLPGRGAEAVVEHRSLIEAIEKGDAVRAEEIARLHIQNALLARHVAAAKAQVDRLLDGGRT